MTVPCRTADELQGAPALATLPALYACIEAFVCALDIAHPTLVGREAVSERDSAALLLHMHLHTCQDLLRLYDHLTFDACCFSGCEDEEPGQELDDDIPF
jgi:hypothetical protein